MELRGCITRTAGKPQALRHKCGTPSFVYIANRTATQIHTMLFRQMWRAGGVDLKNDCTQAVPSSCGTVKVVTSYVCVHHYVGLYISLLIYRASVFTTAYFGCIVLLLVLSICIFNKLYGLIWDINILQKSQILHTQIHPMMPDIAPEGPLDEHKVISHHHNNALLSSLLLTNNTGSPQRRR